MIDNSRLLQNEDFPKKQLKGTIQVLINTYRTDEYMFSHLKETYHLLKLINDRKSMKKKTLKGNDILNLIKTPRHTIQESSSPFNQENSHNDKHKQEENRPLPANLVSLKKLLKGFW